MDEQKDADDILGNRSILKQTIRPGERETRPSRNNVARISYKLYLIDQTTKESILIDEISDEEFFIGEFDVLPAIDLSIQLMDRGERALIDSDIRHCYGEKGLPEQNIPAVIDGEPSYRMKIDLELIDWKVAEEIGNLSIDRRILWSDRKREKGNVALRRQDYPTALHCYRHAVRFVDIDTNPLLNEGEEEETKSKLLIDRYVQVENNLAQVYLLTNQYEQCLETITNVFKYEPKNIKGLFRQAKALFQLGKFDEAIEPLKLLLELDDKDVEKTRVEEMLRICQNKMAKYHRNEKEIYQRMFKSKSASSIVAHEEKIVMKKWRNRFSFWLIGCFIVIAVGIALAFQIENK